MLAEERLEDEDEWVVAVDVGEAVAAAAAGGTGGAAVAVDVDGDVLAEGGHVTLSVARTEKNEFCSACL